MIDPNQIVNLHVTNTAPHVRLAYRRLREAGFPRYDANVFLIGFVLGQGETAGTVVPKPQ